MGFFAAEPAFVFYTFDLVHIIMILLSAIAITLIFIKRDVIANSTKGEKIGYVIGGILLAADFGFYIWKWAVGKQTYFPIPMHLCSWATYIVALSFFIKNKTLFHFAFFYGTIGGFLSIIVPEFGGYSYNHFRFYQFFVLHFIIFAGPVYQAFVYGYKVDYKKMAPIVLGFMYLQAGLAWIVNNYYVTLFEEEVGNGLFTTSPPVPLPGFLGVPVVYLAIFGVIFMILWYGYSKFINNLNNKINRN